MAEAQLSLANFGTLNCDTGLGTKDVVAPPVPQLSLHFWSLIVDGETGLPTLLCARPGSKHCSFYNRLFEFCRSQILEATESHRLNMAYHPSDDVSPFRRRYIIPLWLIRIFFMGLSIVANGIAVGALSYYSSTGEIYEINSRYNLKAAVGVAIAIGVVVMIVVIICLVLDIVCIVKRYRHTLKPRFFLIVNIVQTTMWTVMFIVGFFGALSILSIIVSLIPLMAFWGMLIYAAIIHSRERKGTLNRGAYAPRASDGQFHVQNTSYAVHDSQPYAQNYPEPKHDQTAPGPQRTFAQPYDAQSQGYAAQAPAPPHQDHASTGGQPYDNPYYGPVHAGQGPHAHGSGV